MQKRLCPHFNLNNYETNMNQRSFSEALKKTACAKEL
jgi:hypothetical protein